MKKLLLTIAGVLLFLPIVANAKITGFGVNDTCASGTWNVGETKTCTVWVTTDANTTAISATIAPKNTEYMSILDVKPVTGWTGTTTGGNVNLTNATGKTGKFEVFTYTAKLIKATTNEGDCTVKIKFTNLPEKEIPMVPTVCDPKIKCCPGDTHETNPLCPANPETGSFAPYIMIAGGVLIAASVYLVAKKRNKFYKI